LHILTSLIVPVFKVESMNVTRQISENSKENVDTQINSTARDQEDSERGDEDLLFTHISFRMLMDRKEIGEVNVR